jgi:hypothetical protein
MSSAGLVTTVAQGTTNISAAVGSIQGNAPLSVSSATGGATVVDDLTDSHIGSVQVTDKSVITMFGTRDSSGNPSSLTAITRTLPAGTTEQYTLDSQGRPTKIVLSDQSQFDYDWSASGGPVVTAISGDGTALLSAYLGTSPGTSPAIKTAPQAKLRARAARSDATSSTNSPSLINVHATTSCNGSVVPEDYAKITITLSGLSGDPIPTQWVGPGSGTYLAYLPSGPTTTPQDVVIAAMASSSSTACQAVSAVSDTCTVLLAVASIEAQPLLPVFLPVCAVLDLSLQSVSEACGVVSVASKINSAINYLSNLPTTQVGIVASLAGNPQSTQGFTLSNRSGGFFPPLDIGFECPTVNHVSVSPSSTTTYPGVSFPTAAMAYDVNNQVLLSSILNFTWNSASTSVATYSPLSPSAPIGSVMINGIGPGNTTITATETTSGKTASSSVTVDPVLNVAGLWSGSYTWDQPNGTTVQFSLGISQNAISLIAIMGFSNGCPSCFIYNVPGQVFGNVVTFSDLPTGADPSTTEYFTINATVTSPGSGSSATMTGRICDNNNSYWGKLCGNLSLTYQ